METKRCPFCAEDIRAEAIICRFCHRQIAAPDEETAELIRSLTAPCSNSTSSNQPLSVTQQIPEPIVVEYVVLQDDISPQKIRSLKDSSGVGLTNVANGEADKRIPLSHYARDWFLVTIITLTGLLPLCIAVFLMFGAAVFTHQSTLNQTGLVIYWVFAIIVFSTTNVLGYGIVGAWGNESKKLRRCRLTGCAVIQAVSAPLIDLFVGFFVDVGGGSYPLPNPMLTIAKALALDGPLAFAGYFLSLNLSCRYPNLGVKSPKMISTKSA